MLLEGKLAVVTGAGRGLGKSIAKTLAKEGAELFLIGRSKERLNDVKAQIESDGGCVDIYAADISDERQVEEIGSILREKLQTVDILINNAGISKEMPFADMPMKVWDEIYNVNLRSAVLMMKAILPMMIRQKSGNIVNVGSGAAIRGLPGSAAYSAAKAGLVCLTQALGDEVRTDGIRVNAICPGPIDTEMFKESARRDYILSAGGDVFEPETIANGVLYLVSDMSKGMNSQILTIRGFNRW